MQTMLLASVWHYFFGSLLFLISVFLIGLILLQRGRGGGLTGALGGAGGQSAFGSKTGDVFTKITVVAAGIWIIACLAADKVLVTSTGNVFGTTGGNSTVDSPKKEKSSDKSGASDDATTGDAGAGGKTDAGTPNDSATEGGTKSTTPEAEGEPEAKSPASTSEAKPDAAEAPEKK